MVIFISKIILEGEKGRTFEIDLENPIQKRYEMIRELSLSSKPRKDICAKYGYSRKTGNEYLNAWKEKDWDGLKNETRGPKTKSKRTDKLEKRVLDIRFKDREKDMYDIAEILSSEGYEISARSVARILSEHGITLKKRRRSPIKRARKTKTESRT